MTVLATVLALAAIGLAEGGPASAAGAGAAPEPPLALPARAGDEGVFLLQSGSTLAGRLVSSGPDGDVIRLRSGDHVRLPAGSVIGRVGALAPLGAEPDPGPERESVRIVLRDGRSVSGRVVSREGGTIRVALPDGTTQEIAEAEVVRIAFREEEYRGPPDPARARYMHILSALPFARGDLAVGASSTAMYSAETGLLRWLSVSAGLSLPLVYGTPPPGPAFVADVVARVPITGWLHAAGGVRGLGGEDGFSALLFGAVTAGGPAAHLTLYAGPPLPEAARLGRFDEVVIGAAGSVRVWRHVGLVAEGWVTPRTDEPVALLAAGARLYTRALFVDLGWAQSTDETGVPWVAVGWRGTWSRR
jgi:hypothetical protein